MTIKNTLCFFFFLDCSDSSESNVQRVDKVTGTIERRSNSERKRNVKITSFKSLIESKIFSKSEKELEKLGLGAKTPEKAEKSEKVERVEKAEKEEKGEETIIENTLESETKQLSRSASVISTKSVTNLVKGKSMPSLR